MIIKHTPKISFVCQHKKQCGEYAKIEIWNKRLHYMQVPVAQLGFNLLYSKNGRRYGGLLEAPSVSRAEPWWAHKPPEAPGFYDILDPHMWSNARDDNHSWFTVERTCIYLFTRFKIKKISNEIHVNKCMPVKINIATFIPFIT